MTTQALPKKKLGNSDLDITRIGFGAWAIGGGDWEFAWGAQDDQDSIDAIHRAHDDATRTAAGAKRHVDHCVHMGRRRLRVGVRFSFFIHCFRGCRRI